MTLFRVAKLAAFFLTTAALFVYAKEHNSTDLQLETAGIKSLEIDAGAGELRVTGQNLIEQIQVTASVVGQALTPKDYVLTLEKRGNKAILIAKIVREWSSNDNPAYIDLDVVLPQKLALNVIDGSGDTFVANIANGVKIKDGSGALNVKTITGDLLIDDGSGDMFIATVTGNTEIEDGSGEIELLTVTGDVVIDDGSGELTIDTVDGQVEIEDGSGRIRVENVTGKVSIEDGSGDINVINAAEFSLLDDGSGAVKTKNIGA